MSKIKLGQTVRDLTSGFNGIAISRLDQMNGNVRYAIQPAQKEGEVSMPEAMYVDHHLLEVVDDGISAKVIAPVVLPPALQVLGIEVMDDVTEFQGIATQKSTYMNGCVSFEVLSKDQKKRGCESQWVDYARLTVLSPGVSSKAVEPSDEAPGGPAMRVQRQKVI